MPDMRPYDIFKPQSSDWFIISQLLSSGKTWYNATQRDMSGQLLNMDNKMSTYIRKFTTPCMHVEWSF